MNLLLIGSVVYGTPMRVSIGVAIVLATLVAITLLGNKVVQAKHKDLPAWRDSKKHHHGRFDATKTVRPEEMERS